MSMIELDRFKVIQSVADGYLKPGCAAERLGLTTRQVQRLVHRLRDYGRAGLTSRKRSSPSNHQLPVGIEQRAVALIRDIYADFGPTLAREKLIERHNLVLSKETVRRIMIDARLWVPRPQRPPGNPCMSVHRRRLGPLGSGTAGPRHTHQLRLITIRDWCSILY